jgi:hypothetical protein
MHKSLYATSISRVYRAENASREQAWRKKGDCVTAMRPLLPAAGLGQFRDRPSPRGDEPLEHRHAVRNGTIMKKIALTALVLSLGLVGCESKTANAVENTEVANAVEADVNAAAAAVDNAGEAAVNAVDNAGAAAVNAADNAGDAVANATANAAQSASNIGNAVENEAR